MELFVNDDWVLTDGFEDGNPDNSTTMCLVHVGEQFLKSPFLNSAVRLAQKDLRQLFPGYLIQFHQHPSPGFRISPAHGWDAGVNQRTLALAEKILWEVERAALQNSNSGAL